jgi:glycolate oxidase FAD binding subunit
MMANPDVVVRPTSVDEVVAVVRDHDRIHVVGSATKSALAAPRCDAVRCEMTRLSGVVDHQPSEFLITALAGTRISELQKSLDQHGQYFPFDPPLVDAGATIGGTLAAGLSGPGRLRYGGVRDFVMGLRMVDGTASLITAGGRVVKNAAGYDIPKLMVGSCGYLGAIVELTLKVFPRPPRSSSLRIRTDDFASAVKLQATLSRSPIELTGLDLLPDGTLLVCLSGEETAVATSCDRIASIVTQASPSATVESCGDDDSLWRPLLDASWLGEGDRLVRVPVAPGKLIELDSSLGEMSVPRRYSVAGNLAWIRWPASRPLAQLDEALRFYSLGGSVLLGQASRNRLGVRGDASMIRRIKHALDPNDKFVGFP